MRKQESQRKGRKVRASEAENDILQIRGREVSRSGFDINLAKDSTYRKSDERGKYESCISGFCAVWFRAGGI